MKKCKVVNCYKEARARGLCSAHYSRLRRTGSPTGSMMNIDPDGFTPYQPKINCLIDGCDKGHLCRGYCCMHYQRWLTHGDPMMVTVRGVSKSLCSKCGTKERKRNHSWCSDCFNANGRKRNASEKGPRWRRYKLSRSDVDEMMKNQDNACRICGDSFDNVDDHVDHDNSCCSKEITRNKGTCGECVRDILCGSCNQGLGNFKDDIDRLTSAIAYLEKWSSKKQVA